MTIVTWRYQVPAISSLLEELLCIHKYEFTKFNNFLENIGKFDRITSVGMVEHVGPHNYREFFQISSQLLKEDGIFLLHTIGNNHPQLPCVSIWLHRYIFPNGVIPYYTKICEVFCALNYY